MVIFEKLYASIEFSRQNFTENRIERLLEKKRDEEMGFLVRFKKEESEKKKKGIRADEGNGVKYSGATELK